jgi:hypothetical protein
VHLARQFFDSYKIEFSILNPENILSIGLSPEPDHAAAKASAIIDSGYRLTGAFRYFSISDDCSKLVGR